MRQSILISIALFVMLIVSDFFLLTKSTSEPTQTREVAGNALIPTPTRVLLASLPSHKVLPNSYHIFQSYNNCGPAAFSMALSYYGINKTQEELGQELRPYQNAVGVDDDKSVTLAELAEKAKEYDLIAYHRPNGSVKLVKHFINNDIPVITRTWLEPGEDIGHYRVIKGYNNETEEFIQDDSLQGKDLRFSYDEFLTLWKQFNYEYLVLIPKEKAAIAEAILGEDRDEKTAWKNAVRLSQKELVNNPDDIYARFNLSVAYYHIGEYTNAVTEFEKVENSLPWRTLWYQIEPILAYYELGQYERVFAMTESILNNQNRAFSELYLLRGNIYRKQGNTLAAQTEYQNAVFYNIHKQEAKDALASLQ